jgi:hypothetical protein
VITGASSGALAVAVTITLVFVSVVVSPSWVTAISILVTTVPPAATCCTVGVKVNASNSAVRFAGVSAASV